MAIKQMGSKQWLLPLFKLTVAVSLIAWLVRSGKLDLESLSKINRPEIWLCGVLLFLGSLSINTLRWQKLLALKEVAISYKEAFELSLIGIFFNFVIPGGVGGDVVKGGYLMQDFPQKKVFIGWSLLVDRVLGLLALLTYSAVAGLLFYNQLEGELQFSIYTLSLLLALGISTLIVIVIFLPKQKIEDVLFKSPFLEKAFHPLLFFIKKPSQILFPFVLSFGGQGLMMLTTFALSYFLGLEIPLWIFFLLVPFGFLAMIVPISPAGLGVGQMAFYFLFDKVIDQGEFGILVVTFYQATQFLVGLLGGLLFVLRRKEVERG